MTTEHNNQTAILKMQVIRDGKTIYNTCIDDDLIVNVGKALAAELLGNIGTPVAIKAVAIGTSTTAAAATDTALGTETMRVAVTPTSTTTNTTNDTCVCAGTFSITTTTTITEVGTFNSTTASSGTMYSHDVFTGLPLVNGDTLIMTVNIVMD